MNRLPPLTSCKLPPTRLARFCDWLRSPVPHPVYVSLPRTRNRCCFSSVFETAIGRQAALKLAVELSSHNKAIGFGINHWFDEDDEVWLEHLWNDL